MFLPGYCRKWGPHRLGMGPQDGGRRQCTGSVPKSPPGVPASSPPPHSPTPLASFLPAFLLPVPQATPFLSPLHFLVASRPFIPFQLSSPSPNTQPPCSPSLSATRPRLPPRACHGGRASQAEGTASAFPQSLLHEVPLFYASPGCPANRWHSVSVFWSEAIPGWGEWGATSSVEVSHLG